MNCDDYQVSICKSSNKYCKPTATGANYQCVCRPGYTGYNCETPYGKMQCSILMLSCKYYFIIIALVIKQFMILPAIIKYWY